MIDDNISFFQDYNKIGKCKNFYIRTWWHKNSQRNRSSEHTEITSITNIKVETIRMSILPFFLDLTITNKQQQVQWL
jgi:hypothetical protein